MSTNEVVLISANPRSGASDRLALVAQLQAAIQAIGFECELFTNLAEMQERAKSLAEQRRLRTVVSAGGDGTASRVASLIPDEIPLTLFPTGSENLLAKHLSITTDIQQCARAIERLRIKSLDVMTVNGQISLLMASVGFDAEVVRRVHLARKSHVSKWTYWSAIVRTMFGYRWPALRIIVRDELGNVVDESVGSWVFVFNVPRYASGLSIIDDALDDDGCIDIGIFDRGGLWAGLWNYCGVIMGCHRSMKQWRHFRSHSVQIAYEESNANRNKVTSCQTDGDWAAELPVNITIIERKLRLVVP